MQLLMSKKEKKVHGISLEISQSVCGLAIKQLTERSLNMALFVFVCSVLVLFCASKKPPQNEKELK